MNAQDRYQNKLFSILGDSISTLDGYSRPDGASFYAGVQKFKAEVFLPEDTWWGRVIDRLGGELLVNNSISGSTVSKRPACVVPSYGCSDERTADLGREATSPDVIMVLLGTNDWGCGARLMPDDGVQEDPSVFSVAYSQMLSKLRKNYPNAEIWCFTLPVSTYTKNKGFVFPYCFGGVHIEKYCEAICASAKACGCRVIDLYRSCSPYDTIDGFHPNAQGMKTLADTVISQL